MTYSLVWLPDVLRQANLKVAEVDGWKTRGRGDMGDVAGIICHHTAGPKVGNMPSLKTLTIGRPDLAGPLAQLGLGRDGTYYVIAAGRCNHAGAGNWQGVTYGNSRFIGIEAENAGVSIDEPWPSIQMDAYKCGVAAVLRYLGLSELSCAGHKEFATPKGRKSDPLFDMNDFRRDVGGYMSGAIPPRPLIPAVESVVGRDGVTGRQTLRRGASGDLVRQLQVALAIQPPDGLFGAYTEAAVRVVQRKLGLVPDGIVGPLTWKAISI